MKFLKYLIVISVCMGLVLGIVPISFSQEKSSLGQYPSISEYQKATGKKITRFNEAPILDDLVKQGKLPSVEKRLPDEPAVVEPEEEIGQYGGTWRRAALSPSDTMIHMRLGYEPMVKWARDGKTVIPNLCTSWKVGEGGRAYTFYLRKGLKWSDGEPFTADDVMYWYNDELLNKEVSPVFPSWLAPAGEPVKVEKVDNYTVRFRFKRPYSLFLEYIAVNNAILASPKHYLQQFHIKYTPKEKLDAMVKEAKRDFWYQLYGDKASAYSNPDLPVLRPWKLATSPTGPRATAERNPYYWKVDTAGNQLPYIDRIAFDMVQNTEMITMKAVQGEIDMQGRNLAFKDFTLLMENREKGGYQVYQWDAGETGSAVFFNQNYTKDKFIAGLLKDVRFRTALSLAINRDEINQISYLGQATPTYAIFPKASMQNDPEIRKLYEYNVKEANRLLDSIGLTKKDKDGFRLRPDGKPIQLTILTNVGYAIHPDVMELIAQQWGKVGIKTAVDAITGSLWWPRINSADYQIAGYTLGSLYPGKFLLTYSLFVIPNSPNNYYGPLWGLWYSSGGKAEGSVKPTGDALKIVADFDKIIVSNNQKEIDKLTDEILTLWAKNLWAVPVLGFFNFPVVVRNNFRNVPKEGTLAYPYCSPGYMNPEQFFFKK